MFLILSSLHFRPEMVRRLAGCPVAVEPLPKVSSLSTIPSELPFFAFADDVPTTLNGRLLSNLDYLARLGFFDVCWRLLWTPEKLLSGARIHLEQLQTASPKPPAAAAETQHVGSAEEEEDELRLASIAATDLFWKREARQPGPVL